MDVVGHQAPRDVEEAVSPAPLGEKAQVLSAIRIAEEEALRADAALNDVVRNPGQDDARDASHAEIIT